MLQSIFFLLLFYLLGETISRASGLLVPGSVIGMLLLFGALSLKPAFEKRVQPAAAALTKNIAFFFVPAGVGLMQYFGLLRDHWLAIGTSGILSMLLVMAVVGLLQQRLEKE